MSHTPKKLLSSSFLVLLFAVALPLAADAPPALYELLPERAAAELTVGGPAADARPSTPVAVDVALLAADPAELALPLPDGRRVVAFRRDAMSAGDGQRSWFGDLEGGPFEGSVSLHLHAGHLLGAVRTPDGPSYELVGSDGDYRLTAVEAAAGAGCGLHDAPLGLVLDPLAAPAGEEEGLSRIFAGLNSQTDCNLEKNLLTVDVMVLYPISLLGQATQVHSYATAQINEANNLFSASSVRIRYRLAYVGPITGAAQPPYASYPTQDALNWLNGQVSGAVDTEVELLAKAYGADMISIVVPPHPNTNCGIANLPEILNGNEVMYHSSTPFANKAFSAVELNCGLIDYTFAHELGHNYGMRHDSENRDSREIYPWAYGYVIPVAGGSKATVMACVGGSLPCYRIGLFSNPYLNYSGLPAGTHTPAADQSYNACVANNRAPQYAAIRPLPPSGAPTLKITSPSEGGSVTVGQAFQLVASATDPEQGNLASSVVWTSDRQGSLGTGSPRTVTLTKGGVHLITATVTDASGTKVPYSIRLTAVESVAPTAWIDAPSHNQQVSGTFQVKGWAIDESTVSSIAFKVDGQPAPVSSYFYGIGRSDVCAAYPAVGDPNCPYVGFRVNLDTNQLTNGTHTLRAVVTDLHGNVLNYDRTFRSQNTATTFFYPTADTWVNQASPSSNYGSATTLAVRGTASGLGRHVYLKFSVAGLPRPPSAATLELTSTSTSGTCGVYRMQVNSWSESTLTWNTASQAILGGVSANCTPVGSKVTVNVSSLVPSAGTYTFGINGPDLANMSFYSRESTPPGSVPDRRPVLYVTY